jgi:putative holliday junction resolvase
MSMASSKEAKISHFLGIDFGQSKIGLAIADSETKIAFVFETISNDKEMLKKLAQIVEREGISKVVIGIASYVNKESVACPGERLGNLLKEKLKVEVEYQEEMFTTKQACQNLKEKGAKNIKRFDDQEAARIILQNWLDKKK